MNNKEDWMNKKWRPAMGWMYMLVCITDFILFPVLWSILQTIQGGQVTNQWNPLTLQGAGLFHLAMGAVLGVAAWSRGQEKIAGVSSNNFSPTVGLSGFNQMQATSYESSYTTVAPIESRVIKGYGGKKAPPPAYEPEI